MEANISIIIKTIQLDNTFIPLEIKRNANKTGGLKLNSIRMRIQVSSWNITGFQLKKVHKLTMWQLHKDFIFNLLVSASIYLHNMFIMVSDTTYTFPTKDSAKILSGAYIARKYFSFTLQVFFTVTRSSLQNYFNSSTVLQCF